MKVNGNEQTFTFDHEIGAISGSNIPIRLEIASRILVGVIAANDHTNVDWHTEEIVDKQIKNALRYADALIAEHNKTEDTP